MEACSTVWIINVKVFLFVSLILRTIVFTDGQECRQRLHNSGTRICLSLSCDTRIDCVRMSMPHMECLCDGECGKSCIDPNKRCYPTPSIRHGRVDIDPDDQKFAAIAKYQCNKGYTLVGLPVRICQGDGTWKGNAPRCEQDYGFLDKNEYCGPPPQADNAHHDAAIQNPGDPNRFKLGTNLVYRCNTGYRQTKDSIDKAWCVRGPNWVGPDIVCIEVCGPPPIVEHADHDGSKDQISYLPNAQLTYTCRPGFFTEGSQRAVCMGPVGQWVGPDMSCRSRECPAPGDIVNGRRDPGYRFSHPDRVIYYCNEGFELKGDNFRECKVSGDWSGELPKCERINCEELDAPLHGTRVGSRTSYGSVVRFICNNGYKVVGSVERRCESNGMWSGQRAECKEINCGHPGQLWNGYMDGKTTAVGAIYFFRCDPRTKFNGTDLSTQCMEDGRWSNPLPKCLGQCQVLSIYKGTTHPHMEGKYLDHGAIIEPRCLDGLVMNDSRPVTCNNGTWTITPRCVPGPCYASPPHISHGHRVFFSLAHGAKARYFCFAGHTLENKIQYMKCEFGKWVGDRPSCQENFCPHPGKLQNGHIMKLGVKGRFPFSDYITTIRHGDRLIYECNKDFRLSGPRGAACVNGKWSPKKHSRCERSRHPVFRKLWRPVEEKLPLYY